jgi:hypothetical protein
MDNSVEIERRSGVGEIGQPRYDTPAKQGRYLAQELKLLQNAERMALMRCRMLGSAMR